MPRRRPWWRRCPPFWVVVSLVVLAFVALCVIVEVTTDETERMTCVGGGRLGEDRCYVDPTAGP